MLKTLFGAFFFILSACSSQAPQVPQGVINKNNSIDQTAADVKDFSARLDGSLFSFSWTPSGPIKKFDLASKYYNQPIEVSYDIDSSFHLPLAGEAEGYRFALIYYLDDKKLQTSFVFPSNVPRRKIYVDGLDGDDTQSGSPDDPVKTINVALAKAIAPAEIFVSSHSSVKYEGPFTLKNGVSLNGFYSRDLASGTWNETKSRARIVEKRMDPNTEIITIAAKDFDQPTTFKGFIFEYQGGDRPLNSEIWTFNVENTTSDFVIDSVVIEEFSDSKHTGGLRLKNSSARLMNSQFIGYSRDRLATSPLRASYQE